MERIRRCSVSWGVALEDPHAVPDSGRFTAAERALRSPEAVARTFHLFARNEAPQLDSPLYAELCYGVAGDPELLEIARQTPSEQPPPNMLLAAVQYLLLRGVEHPLRAHYPALSGEPRPLEPTFPLFRDLVLAHREEILGLVSTRRTQTNVIRRCACLLPAFASIANASRQPLALLDLGASAGLNLNFDRYRYAYRTGGREVLRWGDASSPVALSADLRGHESLPGLPAAIPVGWRRGIDLDPIDVEDENAVLWLRALIWPEHAERHARLQAAIAIAREQPPEVTRGDAVELLPELLEQAPDGTALIVYATHALYQLSREGVARILDTLREHAARRPVWLLGLEGTGGVGLQQPVQRRLEHRVVGQVGKQRHARQAEAQLAVDFDDRLARSSVPVCRLPLEVAVTVLLPGRSVRHVAAADDAASDRVGLAAE